MQMYTYSYGNFSGFIPPTRGHYISGAVYALLSFLGIVGNSLVILAVLRYRSLQNSTNAFIVNLAVADLLTSVVLSIYVVSFWTPIFASFLHSFCVFTAGFLRAFITCSSFSLSAISLNRLVIVTQAKRTYRRLFGRRRLIAWIAFMWIYGIVLSFSPHFTGVIRLGFVIRDHQCGVLPLHQNSATIGHVSHAIGTFLLQFLTILVCYVWIYVFVYRHNRRMLNYAKSEPIQAISGVRETKKHTSRKRRTAFSQQVDITKNLFYILCAFVICFVPQMVCSVLGCVNILTKTIVTVNSMVNPIIYGINHPQFRKAFASMFGRCRSGKDVETEDSFAKSAPSMSTNYALEEHCV